MVHTAIDLYILSTYSFFLYCLSRVLVGFFCGGIDVALPVMCNELTGKSKRGIVAAVYSLGWAVGEIVYMFFWTVIYQSKDA